MKTCCILGGHGFIGHHLARKLKAKGYWVRTVDVEEYRYGPYDFTDEALCLDLRDLKNVKSICRLNADYKFSFYPKPYDSGIQFDYIFQLAADMGGAGYVFTGAHDAEIMHNSAQINLNVLEALREQKFKGTVFYSSSACIYPQEIQNDYHNAGLKESDAYPANPDSEYGWEKLFSERLYFAYARQYDLCVRVARFHNIYGPEGTFEGGREKAPAAMCRKVIESEKEIEVWGTGHQTRSFLYIDDCVDAVLRFVDSDFPGPLNIGSEEITTINNLAHLAIGISGKDIEIKNVSGPVGVMGRNSNNDLIREKLEWEPKFSLRNGMIKTFNWIQKIKNGL